MKYKTKYRIRLPSYSNLAPGILGICSLTTIILVSCVRGPVTITQEERMAAESLVRSAGGIDSLKTLHRRLGAMVTA